MTKEKVMVFIDSSNIFHALKRIGFKIDYYKLVKELVGDRTLVRPYYYGSTVPSPRSLAQKTFKVTQEKFHKALRNEGFEIITRPVKVITEDIWVEKGVDIALATDMLVGAHKDLFDTLVLVSGDNDYLPVLLEVRQCGKRVEIAAFENTISQEMKQIADKYIALDSIRDRIQQLKQ
jgi:uncharacterized protein (TIGR00288 family)